MLDKDGNEMPPWGDRVFGPGGAKGCGVIIYSALGLAFAFGLYSAIVGIAEMPTPMQPMPTSTPSPIPTLTDTNGATETDEDTSSPAYKTSTTKIASEMNLKATLKDGDSAIFRKEFVSGLSGGAQMLCGEVNSKNSFGGYIGFKRFIASPNPEAPNMIEGEEMAGMTIDEKTFAAAYKFACTHTVEKF